MDSYKLVENFMFEASCFLEILYVGHVCGSQIFSNPLTIAFGITIKKLNAK